MPERAPPPSETLVVVPAFSEGSAIREVVAELVGHGYPVVVVDDGSSDETGRVARSEGAVVLRHPINRGQGAAIQTGLVGSGRRGTPWSARRLGMAARRFHRLLDPPPHGRRLDV